MAGKVATSQKKPKTQDLSVFINLLTDFGFKRVFGIKYDLICTTGNGERIIVEIQNIEQEYYKDRMLVYISQLIQEQNIQGKVGDKDWNYKLDTIYSINILNFVLGKRKNPKKYLSHWLIKERDTHEVLYDKLTFVCVELPLFDKTLRGVNTALEQWIFLIKRLHELKNIPKKYKTEIFEQIFEMAKIAKMNKKEVNSYINSLNKMNMIQYEINRRDRAIEARDNTISQHVNTISQHVNTISQQGNTIAQMERENAELRRQLGLKQ